LTYPARTVFYTHDQTLLMTRRSKLWRWAVGIFTFMNVAGLGYAAAMDEEMHAMSHLFLLLLTLAGYVGWRLARRGQPQDPAQVQLAEQRIEYLQQSIDAMALELERVGEAQRFSDKLRVERGETPPLKKEN
jgi:hypothetical protein